MTPPRALAAAVALGVAVVSGAPAPAQTPEVPPPDPELAARLAGALKAPALRGAEVGALVVDAASGRVLFEHHPDRALVPASNLKIFTALAALRAFGPAHRFTTSLYADAPPDADGAVDTLYVRGGGDPGLTSEDLWRLAADLHREGVRRVRGDLVIDDSLFDSVRWHPSWLPVSARAYHAPVGAFTVNYGAYAVVVEAGASVGARVQVALDPPVESLRVLNRARTAPPNAPRRLVVDRRDRDDGEDVVVGGSWPLGARETFHRSVLDPARYAAAVLRLQLGGLGIAVDGAFRRGAVPLEAVELLAFEGRPVSDIVQRLLKFSSNPIGEGLLKALAVRAGAVPADWQHGALALRDELAALGLPLDALVVVDGSGLSYDARATPRLLVAALRRGRDSFGFGPEFVAALPIAGADGTLAERAEAAHRRVRAKTGLLTRVTSLSGLAERPDGTTAAFALMVNGFRSSAREAMDAVDAFAAALSAAPEPGGDDEPLSARAYDERLSAP